MFRTDNLDADHEFPINEVVLVGCGHRSCEICWIAYCELRYREWTINIQNERTGPMPRDLAPYHRPAVEWPEWFDGERAMH